MSSNSTISSVSPAAARDPDVPAASGYTPQSTVQATNGQSAKSSRDDTSDVNGSSQSSSSRGNLHHRHFQQNPAQLMSFMSNLFQGPSDSNAHPPLPPNGLMSTMTNPFGPAAPSGDPAASYSHGSSDNHHTSSGLLPMFEHAQSQSHPRDSTARHPQQQGSLNNTINRMDMHHRPSFGNPYSVPGYDPDPIMAHHFPDSRFNGSPGGAASSAAAPNSLEIDGINGHAHHEGDNGDQDDQLALHDPHQNQQQQQQPLSYDPYQVKHRKRTSPEQLAVLESSFAENPKPSAMTRKLIAEQIGMTPRSVQVWFQNRRQKRKTLERKRMSQDSGGDSQLSSFPSQTDQNHPTTLNTERRASSKADDIQHYGGSFVSSSSSGGGDPVHRWGSGGTGPVNGGSPNGAGVHHIRHASSQEFVRPHHPSVHSSMKFATSPRRGSLPYPPPLKTLNENPQESGLYSFSGPASHLAKLSNSQTLGPSRTHIPLHVATAMGGRRASLPMNNPRSGSRGPFVRPHQVNGGGLQNSLLSQPFQPLAPNACIEQDVPPLSADMSTGFSTDNGMPLTGVDPLFMSAAANHDSMGLNMAPPAGQALPGPLPNPDYSFGLQGTCQVGGADGASTHHSLATHPFVHPSPYPYRDRLGSMASVFSQASQVSTEASGGGGAPSGDWGDTATLPGYPSVFPWPPNEKEALMMQGNGGGGASDADGTRLTLPLGFASDARRASAPADMLQKLNMETTKQSSPLNPGSLDSPASNKEAHDAVQGNNPNTNHHQQHHNHHHHHPQHRSTISSFDQMNHSGFHDGSTHHETNFLTLTGLHEPFTFGGPTPPLHKAGDGGGGGGGDGGSGGPDQTTADMFGNLTSGGPFTTTTTTTTSTNANTIGPPTADGRHQPVNDHSAAIRLPSSAVWRGWA